MSSHLLFTCAKNEGPFLLEWVGYHHALGFSEILIFTNDCADGTDALADRLEAMGLVRHVRNPVPAGDSPQWQALRSAPLAEALAQADWATHLDLDEYLTIFAGTGHLTDLPQDADAIAIPWRFFGNAGQIAFTDTPVTKAFIRAAPYLAPFPRVALMFKTLFRPAAFAKPGIHAPRARSGEAPRWLTGNGIPASATFAPERSMLTGPNAGNTLAQINHYALKSAESFLVKADRGLANRKTSAIDLAYWIARNFNQDEDTRLSDRSVAAKARADLLEDRDLKHLHRTACAWHTARAKEMLETEAGLSLFSAITTAGPSHVPAKDTVLRIYRAMGRVYGGGV